MKTMRDVSSVAVSSGVATAASNQKAPSGLAPGIWWALVRGPKSLPVLFSSYTDACENQDYDEYIVRVRVTRSRTLSERKHRR